MQNVKVRNPLPFFIIAVLFLFFFVTENFASNACGFLKNVKNAADHIAFAVEQAERTAVNHDTLTVYLYGDDYRDIQKYLTVKESGSASAADPEKRVKLDTIKILAVEPAPNSTEKQSALLMKFTNETGNMLPQNILVRVANCPAASSKPMNVRLMRGNSARPVAPASVTQTAASVPAGNSHLDKTPSGNPAATGDVPKQTGQSAGDLAANSAPLAQTATPNFDIKSLLPGVTMVSPNANQAAAASIVSVLSGASGGGGNNAQALKNLIQSALQQGPPSQRSGFQFSLPLPAR
jgi:hypothetical protein